MRRKKPPYFIPLVIVGLTTSAFILWQLIWSLRLRDLPVAFEISLLEELSYVREISASDQKEPVRRFGYNIVKSHVIKPDRILPETRHPNCRMVSGVDLVLPSISIIITFSSVDRSVLLRNLVSIFTRSDPVGIQEIIIVDDGSSDESDGQQLKQLPGIRIIRNQESLGRGVARNQGAAVAVGEVLVFVDCLAEVNVDWLLPLVLRLVESPKSIVAPVLDSIHYDTLDYRSSVKMQRGGFDWSLQYRWEDIPLRYHKRPDSVSPYRSPTLVGGVLALRKDFFNRLGRYDSGPWAKETEDMELSLRAWMCGGQVEIIPCSRVGLIQVKGQELGLSPVSFNTYSRSARRIAELWLDEYKRFFYAVRPSARMTPAPDVSAQRKLKEKLKCRSFKWFITAVYPQLQPLITDEIAYGSIQQGANCLDLDPGQLPVVTKLRPCDPAKDSQEWSWRKRGIIVSNGMCLTSDLMNMQGFVVVQFCKDMENQLWYRHEEKIVHLDTNLCLDGQQGDTGLLITDCIKDSPTQRWAISDEKKTESSQYFSNAGNNVPVPHDHPL